MPTDASRTEVQELVAAGAQLLDVRPAEEFASEHIAGARNIPPKTLDGASAAELDRARPVIVY